MSQPTRGIVAQQITKAVIEVLKNNPQGLRYTDIINRVKEVLPTQNVNTIVGTMYDITTKKPNPEISRPERGGLYKHISFSDKESVSFVSEETQTVGHSREQDFYQSFADFLKVGLQECTEAIPLGGNRFGGRWGTPDVIGIYKSRDSDPVKRETEVVSAEIKTDSQGLITAFGQASAYLLFSHKVYIAIPKNSSPEDVSRLESLCLIVGIGLVVFDGNNKENPNFEIKTRPIKREPDIFYVNKFIALVEEGLF